MNRQRKSSNSNIFLSVYRLLRRRWGIAAFVIASLFCAYMLQESEKSVASTVVEAVTREATLLSDVMHSAKVKGELPTFIILGERLTYVGSVLQRLMVFASEKQENAPLLIEPAIVEATKIYRESVSTLSIAVSALLQMKTLTAKETESLWFFFAVTSHALCAVMPEYFLAVDDFGTHAEALAKGLRLLMYASNMAGSNATGGRLPLVNCAQHGKETQWLNFCVSSFETPSSLEVRRAAVLEEMIALFPEYAPLRLHYAVSLAMSHQLIGTDSVISLINSEREKLSTRAHIDPHHDSFLSLCKAFVLSTTNITSAAPNVTAVNATDLQTVAHEAVKRLEEIATCNSLFRPFASDGNSSWTAMFRNAGRPDVIDKWQAMKLLSTMKTLKQQFPVGEEISDALPEGFANCSG